ncbi:MAG: response regulator, partial [Deltaproteobacteria bacterium]|nr:response regulator [Deltaproteobacteria bacterium]
NHEKIFDAFEQVEGFTTRKYHGSGLGLAISSQLVRMMGGRIWVESEVGVGSTFHFTVPLRLQKGLAHLPEVVEMSSLKGLPVLVVDDNLTARRVLEELLSGWGMNPIGVDNGQAALEAMEAACTSGTPFNLVIVGSTMQDMDGFELAERINRNPSLIGSSTIMLASTGARGDAARCQKMGIAAYLPKPINQADLFDAISGVLGASSGATVRPSLITRYSIRESRRRLRILLVEDNEVNRLMTRRILEKMGHAVSTVENGKEALEMLEKESFDLVLMDIQMPEMDGVEATIAIREREKIRGEHVPVVAMTACAMESDRERCLESGMDDYLSKPVKSEELFRTIERLSSGLKASQAPQSRISASTEVLDEAELLDQVEGDRALLKQVVDVALKQCPLRLSEIRQAVDGGDAEKLYRIAHPLKGMAGQLAAHAAWQAAFKLESMGRSGDMSRASEAMDELETAF